MRLALVAIAAVTTSSAALAHSGSHTHFSIATWLSHVTEPDHLALLAGTVIVGIIAYRMGRRAEARAKMRARNDGDSAR